MSGLLIQHKRKVYGFIDLLGDLGGVLEVIMVLTGAFLFPISEHHFTLQAAKRIFLARTTNSNLFESPHKGNMNIANNIKMLKFADKKLMYKYSHVFQGRICNNLHDHNLSNNAELAQKSSEHT